ncbi:hypothetical protein Scep_005232 [Stephania cephalantha]|uniref:Uncharacterized protein n=1 Tax=Stephania cephalantha TaxID=152367 RepID=A0AAP0KVC1_9MAGN
MMQGLSSWYSRLFEPCSPLPRPMTAIGTLCGLVDRLGEQGNVGIAFVRLMTCVSDDKEKGKTPDSL